MNQIVVHNIEFTTEGLAISYGLVPKDLRKNGLVWQHQVLVPTGSDYDDEIAVLDEALTALMNDVLDDEERAESLEPHELLPPNPDDEDTDDD